MINCRDLVKPTWKGGKVGRWEDIKLHKKHAWRSENTAKIERANYLAMATTHKRELWEKKEQGREISRKNGHLWIDNTRVGLKSCFSLSGKIKPTKVGPNLEKPAKKKI